MSKSVERLYLSDNFLDAILYFTLIATQDWLDLSSLLLAGVFFTLGVVGPAVGFGLGGQFLNIYIDSPNVEPAL